jgi:hypothetical protein
MKLYTTESVAGHLGVRPITVMNRVLRLGIEPAAQLVAGSGREFALYTAEAIEQIRPTIKTKNTET